MSATSKQPDPASVRQDQLVRRLQAHIAMMAPHQKERSGGQLLIEATAEIQRLRDALGRIAEVGHCGSGVAPRIAKDTLSPNSELNDSKSQYPVANTPPKAEESQ